ncbi:MAG: DUF2147 domain-containing protein [Nitrospirae bacterium]|nr:DUF2147 domain-containing protein [Nitrospirota bacterium]
MIKRILLALLFSLSIAIRPTLAFDDDILGLWDTEEKDAVIEMFKCGQKYCGRIFWVKEPNYSAGDKNGKGGRPILDDNNPDANLRNRPIVGLQIINDFSFAGDNSWTEGNIYDPERGKAYSGRMNLTSQNSLNVRGYILIPLLGRTTTWTRRVSTN